MASKITIIDKKSFTVGRRKVKVQRQDEVGSDKPHQVLITLTVKGITRRELNSYPPGMTGNRDFQYIDFDEKKAEKLVATTLKWLTTGVGKVLLEEDAK